jgi:peptidoglycan hydrolase-like protein with peptidoglycan-binding domain
MKEANLLNASTTSNVCSTSTASTNNPASLSSPAGESSFAGQAFTRDLTIGSTGADVKALQQYLNTHGFTVAETGAGSSGHETTYFGPATKAALIKFQEYYDISISNSIINGLGYFGPVTRGKVNMMIR